ncbi:hypothetical protein JAAARDRAFT_189038 [Jaapia argillacea MUCL 33604]|uniref:Mid2 domain-containing protein n=1 Tax=Jaapia argillacea MUCL 33604 TaxID=933084 RepID=A0A067QIZ7_9AGAM|nr:hypothetical protein JAAARDRAFT_189038 [Jaapia argillacea MUCL 33604]
MHLALFYFVTLLGFSSSLVRAFTFTFGTPAQCNSLSLSWTGGQAPFQLLLIPVFGTPRNISIPATAFSNGRGTFETPLPFAKGQQFMITMSDATGFGSGGVTKVLTAGPSQGANCATTDPGVAFQFQLNDALQQCRPFTFSAYTGAVQPVTIYGLIPGGESFVLNPPEGPVSFAWPANVAAGTSILFAMVDAQGRQGGSSDVRLVGLSNDATCLNTNSPSSVPNPPAVSTSATASASRTAAPKSTTAKVPAASQTSGAPVPSKSTGSAGVIIGLVIGGLIGVAAVGSLGWFYWQKRRNNNSPFDLRNSHPLGSVVDLGGAPPPIAPYPYTPPSAPPPSARPFTASHPYGTQRTYDNDSTATYPTSPSTRYEPTPYMTGSSQQSHTQPPPSVYAASSVNDVSPYGSDATQSLQPQAQAPSLYRAPSVNEANPFGSGAVQSSQPQTYSTRPASSVQGDQIDNRNSVSVTSSGRSKASQAGLRHETISRFIVHTDAEEIEPDENGVVELPPQYSERRGPVSVVVTPPEGTDVAGPSMPPTSSYRPTPPSQGQAPTPYHTPHAQYQNPSSQYESPAGQYQPAQSQYQPSNSQYQPQYPSPPSQYRPPPAQYQTTPSPYYPTYSQSSYPAQQATRYEPPSALYKQSSDYERPPPPPGLYSDS